MRLVGATASGWLADRIGRKTPLMISIAWYSVCNFLAGLAPSFFLLFLFRALLGIGMAGRRRPRDGDLAGALARLYGRRDAGLVGHRLPDVERDLRAVLQLYRLARPLDDRDIARPPDHLDSALRQGAPDLGREPAPADIAGPRGAHPAVLDFQARHAGKHADDLPDDGERLRHLLCELRAVRDPSAARPQAEPGLGRAADRAGQHMLFSLVAVLGLAGGTHRPALGDPYSGGARGADRVPLPDDRRLHVDRRRICTARDVRLRRHARSIPGLSLRTVPDRSARDGGRLLLPPGGDLGRSDFAAAPIIRHHPPHHPFGPDPH